METNKLKCADLRIGNYLKYNYKIVEVFGLRPRYVEYYDEDEFLVGDNPEYFEPIELTEEVLLKIGFKKEERISSILYYLDYEIDLDECIRVKYLIYDSKALPLLRITSPSAIIFESHELTKRGIKYLHQLQNSYYCLTGQELEVEL